MHTNKVPDPTKVITGPETRWAYVNVWEPRSFDGSPARYSVCLIIPKTDVGTLRKIQRAKMAAWQVWLARPDGGWNSSTEEFVRDPLHDGDLERPDDPAYENAFFLHATSLWAPEIVDENLEPVKNREQVYSGVYGRASIRFFAYKGSDGTAGITARLNHLQLLSSGEMLGGRSTAQEDFALAEDEDDPDFPFS